MKRSPRLGLKDRSQAKLDELFSELIRRRALARVGGCERCRTGKTDYKQLQCCHIFGRKRRLVRWDPDNALGMCPGCHMYLDSQPTEMVAFARQQLGEQGFLLLEARASQVGKPDIRGLMLYYGELLKQMEG